MKKTNLILTIILIICIIATTVYANSAVRIYVNGMRVNTDAILQNDRTYIPVRAVSEALGAEVSWDDSTKSAHISFTEDDAISKIVSDVSPSVVAIIGNYYTSDASSSYNNLTVHGSGVIYKSNGYIITNAHVVKDVKNLTVVLYDGTTLPGQVLLSDESADLAIVKIDKIGLRPVTMAKMETVLSGKSAIAIGTPISMSMRNTVTKGIISGCDVSLNDAYYKLIQTDATVNPGNSGGALLNTKGELVGINSSKYAGVGIDNMAFAIPVDTVEYIISQFEKNGKVLRPSLNVTFDQSWEAKTGLPTKKGITVKTSSDTRLLVGDIINSVNGIKIHSITDFNEAVKDTYDGKNLQINLTRDGAVMDVLIQN